MRTIAPAPSTPRNGKPFRSSAAACAVAHLQRSFQLAACVPCRSTLPERSAGGAPSNSRPASIPAESELQAADRHGGERRELGRAIDTYPGAAIAIELDADVLQITVGFGDEMHALRSSGKLHSCIERGLCFEHIGFARCDFARACEIHRTADGRAASATGGVWHRSRSALRHRLPQNRV